MITLEENINRLNNISKLENNWDGYLADPIPTNIINKIEKLLPQFYFQPKIFPTAIPSIQLEWEDNYTYMEIEFRNNNHSYIMIIHNKDYNNANFFEDIDINQINELLKENFKDLEKIFSRRCV